MADDASVGEAIDRLMADAQARGTTIRTGEAARRLAADHPDWSVPLRALAQEIARKAVAAGVPIQFTKTE